MTSALERPFLGPTTVEHWLTLDPPPDGSRLELLLGHLHVSPSPSFRHQRAGDELRELIKYAIRAANRTDLQVVTAIGVEISTGLRTAVIPDVVLVLDEPNDICAKAEQVALIVEIWSPGNSRGERETKKGAYASAGIPGFWEIDQGRVRAYYLENGRYVEEISAGPGDRITVRRAAPVPVTFDPVDLQL